MMKNMCPHKSEGHNCNTQETFDQYQDQERTMRDCAPPQQAVSAILEEGYPLVLKRGLHGMHGS